MDGLIGLSSWHRYCRDIGEPIKACAAGRVILLALSPSMAVPVIEHPDGKETLYAHVQAIKVAQGDTVAGVRCYHVGMTGRTTGPHLHLEVRNKGNSAIR